MRIYNRKNVLGFSFGWWKVIGNSEKKGSRGSYFWICKCKCGNQKEVCLAALQSGKSTSCGCTRLKKNRREKVFKNKYKVKENGCWEWKGSRDKNGYGLFGVKTKAHRYSFEKYKGPIPEGMNVCHNCPGGDNTGCVNPDHLWLGTSLENIRDKDFKGKQNKGENHGRAKLTEEDVFMILKRLSKGEFATNIAKEYGVSFGLIYHIKHGRAWKHLHYRRLT